VSVESDHLRAPYCILVPCAAYCITRNLFYLYVIRIACGGGDNFSSRRAVKITPTLANVKLPFLSEANKEECPVVRGLTLLKILKLHHHHVTIIVLFSRIPKFGVM